jgi:hypothetical protein
MAEVRSGLDIEIIKPRRGAHFLEMSEVKSQDWSGYR